MTKHSIHQSAAERHAAGGGGVELLVQHNALICLQRRKHFAQINPVVDQLQRFCIGRNPVDGGLPIHGVKPAAPEQRSISFIQPLQRNRAEVEGFAVRKGAEPETRHGKRRQSAPVDGEFHRRLPPTGRNLLRFSALRRETGVRRVLKRRTVDNFSFAGALVIERQTVFLPDRDRLLIEKIDLYAVRVGCARRSFHLECDHRFAIRGLDIGRNRRGTAIPFGGEGYNPLPCHLGDGRTAPDGFIFRHDRQHGKKYGTPQEIRFHDGFSYFTFSSVTGPR